MSRPTAQTLLAVVCAFVAAVNLHDLLSTTAHLATKHPRDPRNYSYVGSDFPRYLVEPQDAQLVAMDVEESVHHGLGKSAMSDWEDTVDAFAWYKLGPTHHRYSPSMYHQMHCLRMIHRALFPAIVSEQVSNSHAQHCLNYLRQMTLCSPDRTLEPADVLSRDWKLNSYRGGSTHVCRDWSRAVTTGYEQREAWKQEMVKQWE